MALLLTGCASGTVANPTPSPTETVTPTLTPEAPAASGIIISLESVTVTDQDGEVMQAVPFTDPDAMIALVTDLTGGSAPTVEDFSPKGFQRYEWDGIVVIAYPASFRVTVTVPEIGGLPVSTADGIHVGSTRSELAALSPFDAGEDADGDGSSDTFGLEARQNPGHESLSFPGQPGTDFIGVSLKGDSVTQLTAPDSDYGDI